MAENFPADFYVTCATVIPVLFLALVVQGGTYESMLRTALEAAHRQPMRSRDNTLATFLPLVPYFALIAGVLGEVAALSALYSGSDPNRSSRCPGDDADPGCRRCSSADLRARLGRALRESIAGLPWRVVRGTAHRRHSPAVARRQTSMTKAGAHGRSVRPAMQFSTPV